MGPLKQVSTRGLTFKDLRESDKFYVDKTLLIKDILEDDDRGVYLFTRPRRFGKSTNISMLDAFFNMRYEGNDWFDGLAISRYRQFDRYRNAFPVICLDLKDTASDSVESFRDALVTVVQRAMLPFVDVLESDGLTRMESSAYEHLAYRTASWAEVRDSVSMLCRILERTTGRKAIVLVDEYDRPVTDAIGTELQRAIGSHLKGFLTSTLKGNESLFMGYLTGVMQVAKAGMFSDMNNIKVNNVFSLRSDERFGFTEDEVLDLLQYYGRPDRMDEVREWYDGYRFGDTGIYNPFSLMTYVSEGFTPRGYWMNSGENTAIRWMLERVDMDSLSTVANIVNGGTAVCSLHDSMTFDDLRLAMADDLYSLMVMTGYLKATPADDLGRFTVSLPNREVREVVDRMLRTSVRAGDSRFGEFRSAVTAGDAERMAEVLGDILADSSHLILRDEASFETMVLTIMHEAMADYTVRAEQESGNGRADIVMTPKREGMVPVIMELRVADREEDLDAETRRALDQIHSRRYYLGMKGDVVLVGLAFWGKVPRVRTEVVRLRSVNGTAGQRRYPAARFRISAARASRSAPRR